MNNNRFLLLIPLLLFATSSSLSFSCDKDGVTGFFPDSAKIKVNTSSPFLPSGISKEDFEDVLSRLDKIYSPVVKGFGAKLKFVNNWDNDTINAYAKQSDENWIVAMFGGFARYSGMTKDSFTLVACHELGHHIGGAPKKEGFDAMWASNEGQADYFASLKCFRKYADGEDHEEIIKDYIHQVPSEAIKSCSDSFLDDSEKALCIRTAHAGFQLAEVMRHIMFDTLKVSLAKKSPIIVKKTNHDHPNTQCRLDTFFAGSLCNISMFEEVSQQNPEDGSCTVSKGYEHGVRPLCWYKP